MMCLELYNCHNDTKVSIVTSILKIDINEDTVAPGPHPWGVHSKAPSGCPKPWMVSDPIYTVFFCIHTQFNL